MYCITSIVHCYTIDNEKYFQKVSFCVITHLIDRNGRTVCKDMVTMEIYEAPRTGRGQPAGHRSRVRVQPWGLRPRLQYSQLAQQPSQPSPNFSILRQYRASSDAGLSGVRMLSLYSQAGSTKVSDFLHIYASYKARLKRRGNYSLSYLFIESITVVSMLEWS